jgi:hypothetical protein
MILAEWSKAYDRMFGEMDSRLSRWKKGSVRGRAGPITRSVQWEPIFCIACGRAGGYVTAGTPVLYNCEKCEATHGALPLPKVPAILEQGFP